MAAPGRSPGLHWTSAGSSRMYWSRGWITASRSTAVRSPSPARAWRHPLWWADRMALSPRGYITPRVRCPESSGSRLDHDTTVSRRVSARETVLAAAAWSLRAYVHPGGRVGLAGRMIPPNRGAAQLLPQRERESPSSCPVRGAFGLSGPADGVRNQDSGRLRAATQLGG